MTSESRIESLSSHTSRIVVGQGILRQMQRGKRRRAVVVADRAVTMWAGRVVDALADDGGWVDLVTMEFGESKKNLETLREVYEAFSELALARDTLVVAVGGGVTTDLVGFAAASYLRGLDWIAVPTSLLAQVDAAIGGKVGVNLSLGKNLVGAFHLPREVWIDGQTLTTLPESEWRAGVGEVLKSALIAGGPLFERLSGHPPLLGQVGPEWVELLRMTAQIKVDICNQDLKESDRRMVLNFGHTLGHALEQWLGYGQIRHGEAVGLGSLFALALSEEMLGLESAVRRSFHKWLTHWGLPTTVPPVTLEELRPALTRDKKSSSQGLRWILLRQVGDPEVTGDVPDEALVEALHRAFFETP